MACRGRQGAPTTMDDSPPFWTRPLGSLTSAEWEALCDGCGRCCTHSFEDSDTGALYATDIACRLLDPESCRCRHYPDRLRHVPECVQMTASAVATYRWLPSTCAYRRLAEGRGLADWHPLVSGDPESVHRAGVSVRGQVVPETRRLLNRWEERILVWKEPGR